MLRLGLVHIGGQGFWLRDELGDWVGYAQPANMRDTMLAGVEARTINNGGFQCLTVYLKLVFRESVIIICDRFVHPI